MNAAELLQKIIRLGADESGIDDRFGGNAALYERCFLDFVEEPNVALLQKSILEKDYQKAFAAAHALKGLSGNLGVTGYYDAICVLVESLRAKQYDTLEAEHAEVDRQFKKLKSLLFDNVNMPDAPAAFYPRAEKQPQEAQKPQGAKDRFWIYASASLSVILILVGLLFMYLFSNYRKNISAESAEHLTEINFQLKLYIEERIQNDWRTARSVGESIKKSNFVDDDAAIFALMQEQRFIWQATDLMLYTADGYAISADGKVAANDVASDTVARAQAEGEYLSVIDSDLIYTVPVETALRFRGERIVAVSVIQSMGSFLDNMEFSSFHGEGWMYLTESDGVVLSRQTNDASLPVFNVMAITKDSEITPAADDALTRDDILKVKIPSAFIIERETERDYLVVSEIVTSGEPLRLFYFAPVAVVNETMNSFSRQLLFASFLIILLVTTLALTTFLYIYGVRKRRFDSALLARERMLDLLIENTQTAFGLFTVNESTPAYISSNTALLIGESYYTLEEKDGAYRMHGVTDAMSSALSNLNDTMQTWDGKTPFRSGYLQNDKASPPNYFEIRLYPVDEAGQDFVGIAQDVTKAYEREMMTRNALEMAERANEAKSRFLSNMSHDIRTPMNAIMNMTSFAIDSADQPKKLVPYLNTIRDSSEQLLRLINDVLDMSRIESGQVVIGSAPFDLLVEMKRQADMIRPLCQAKEQTLLADFTGIHTKAVLGDALKVTQIMTNLLSNAVKFTPKNGAVRFTVAEIPSLRENLVDVRFTVEDNGMGISQEYLSHIFEPFSRADDKRISRIEGTGLGLSICHSYVAAMGGTISVESEEGKGSTFTVELFFEKAGALPVQTAYDLNTSEVPFLGKRCLVGEDNGINQTIAKTMLERLGFMVELSADGQETVKKFMRSRPGYYDVIYMDIQMPVMDGYQATVAIRESEHPAAKSIPIVAMTANVFAEDIEKARIAGMDGYLGKPIISMQLIDETSKAIHKREEAEK